MASNYPSSLDSFTDPLSNSPLNNPSHAGQHQDLNNSVEQLETKLGTGASAASSATANQVLVANGSGGSSWAAVPEYSLQTGLVYLGSTTLTGSSVSTNYFSSAYDAYKFVFSALVTDISGVLVLAQLLNGTTPLTTSTYSYTRFGYNGTLLTDNNVGVSRFMVGTYDNASSGGSFEIYDPFKTSKTTVIGQSVYNAAANMGYPDFCSGVNSNATSYDGLKLWVNGGNFVSGAVRVYGYRK